LLNDKSALATIQHQLKNFNELMNTHNIQFGSPISSVLINDEQNMLLKNWTGKQNWKLLFRASSDGKSAKIFHQKCDNQGETVIIIKSDNNCLFGGYTSISWRSVSKYVADTKSFIFTLINPHNVQPTKYPCTNRLKSIYDHPSYAPTFGGGEAHDVYVSPNFNADSYTYLGSSYSDTTGKGNSTFTGSYNYSPSDVEVFQVS
jgi:hypothetical protein